MKNHSSAWLMVLLLGLVLLLIHAPAVRASHSKQLIAGVSAVRHQQVIQTPMPIDTSEARVLPSVGGNAGLVLGAAVLVLIIIGGVIISTRWRSKH